MGSELQKSEIGDWWLLFFKLPAPGWGSGGRRPFELFPYVFCPRYSLAHDKKNQHLRHRNMLDKGWITSCSSVVRGLVCQPIGPGWILAISFRVSYYKGEPISCCHPSQFSDWTCLCWIINFMWKTFRCKTSKRFGCNRAKMLLIQWHVFHFIDRFLSYTEEHISVLVTYKSLIGQSVQSQLLVWSWKSCHFLPLMILSYTHSLLVASKPRNLWTGPIALSRALRRMVIHRGSEWRPHQTITYYLH